MVESRVDAVSRKADDLWFFALTVDHRRSLARAPELVGAFTRDAIRSEGLGKTPFKRSGSPSASLLDFVESKRAYLPPRGNRVRAAYLPDVPLPR